MPIKDADIRKSLLYAIHKNNSKSLHYRVLPELVVCDGCARVDVAVANGHLCGYEIKSDVDSLERLSNQCSCYNRTFEKMYIVVGKKYIDKIASFVPAWWGIYYADKKRDNRRVSLVLIKKAGSNPNVDPHALLELLWASEIKTLLKEWSINGISGKNRRILRDIACAKIPYNYIKNYTLNVLKNREDWR